MEHDSFKMREEIREWILSEDSNKIARGWSPKTDAFSYESDGFLVYLPVDSANYIMEYIGKNNTKELNDIVDFAHAELLETEEKKESFDAGDYFDATIEQYDYDLLRSGYKFCCSDVKRIGSISVYERDQSVVCIVGDIQTFNVSIYSFKNMEEFVEWFRHTEEFHSQ
jgi:hypothetical protein